MCGVQNASVSVLICFSRNNDGSSRLLKLVGQQQLHLIKSSVLQDLPKCSTSILSRVQFQLIQLKPLNIIHNKGRDNAGRPPDLFNTVAHTCQMVSINISVVRLKLACGVSTAHGTEAKCLMEFQYVPEALNTVKDQFMVWVAHWGFRL